MQLIYSIIIYLEHSRRSYTSVLIILSYVNLGNLFKSSPVREERIKTVFLDELLFSHRTKRHIFEVFNLTFIYGLLKLKI